MQWEYLFQFFGGTAIFFAAAAWITQSTIRYFFSRNLEQYRLDLAAQNEKQLAQLKHEYSLELATFRSAIEGKAAKQERIRVEVLRWANPILESVNSLQGRLSNILKQNGYVALRSDFKHEQWSVDYDYFMSATLYSFACYFFWVNRLRETLSFEIFAQQADKDAFFAAIDSVSRKLRSYPVKSYSCKGPDFQVFKLQQQAIGEAMAVGTNNPTCMSYHQFLAEHREAPLCNRLEPLFRLVDGITPSDDCRWKRLLATYDAVTVS